MNELLQNPQLNIPVVNGSAFIPSDFRIGNYVASKQWKGYGQIEGIEVLQDRIDFKVKGFIHSIEKDKYFDLRELKLSSDLLLKAGFQKDGILYSKDKFAIKEWKVGSEIEWVIFWGNNVILYERNYQFHKLQNLLYSLSGSELSLS